MSRNSRIPTVLIVDDESLVRRWIRTALNTLECRVLEEVSDGAQAVQRHVELNPDITFLDIDMPTKNGLDTLSDILHRNSDAFVVMVSAHSTLDNVQLAIEKGASGFVVKPFTVSKFKMVVDKYRTEVAKAWNASGRKHA